jgi:3',5'-cyclic AMP phosphodiesterase CpdA
MDHYKIAHISDLHICSLKELGIDEILNQRILGYLSWRMHRGNVHRDEVLSALQQDVHTLSPDHTVVTGDLTHLGTPRQFKMAQKFLHALGKPTGITVIPGNHDAYIRTAWEQTFALWEDYMAPDESLPGADVLIGNGSAWPSLRVRGETAIVGVSTSRPSAPFFATGSVGHSQLQRLENMLQDLSRQQLFRIVLIHHPPAAGVVGWRRRLTDAPAFRDVVGRCGAELVLHGHVHRTCFTHLSTPDGKVASISVPSASALSQNPERRARYHVYHVSRTSKGWDVMLSVRGYSMEDKEFRAEGEPRPLRFNI